MNASKANSPRFWSRWRASGAVSGMPAANAPAVPKAKPASRKKVKAATPPATPAVFGTRDLGKDAKRRWGIVNKQTKQVVDYAASRSKAREVAKALTEEAAAA